MEFKQQKCRFCRIIIIIVDIYIVAGGIGMAEEAHDGLTHSQYLLRATFMDQCQMFIRDWSPRFSIEGKNGSISVQMPGSLNVGVYVSLFQPF